MRIAQTSRLIDSLLLAPTYSKGVSHKYDSAVDLFDRAFCHKEPLGTRLKDRVTLFYASTPFHYNAVRILDFSPLKPSQFTLPQIPSYEELSKMNTFNFDGTEDFFNFDKETDLYSECKALFGPDSDDSKFKKACASITDPFRKDPQKAMV